jgi:hypothetical protein
MDSQIRQDQKCKTHIVTNDQDASNYNYSFSTLPQSQSELFKLIDELYISKSIDVVSFTIKEPRNLEIMSDLNSMNLFYFRENQPTNSRYKRQRFYYSPAGDLVLRILFEPQRSHYYLPAMMIYIYRPSKDTISLLNQLFKYYNLSINLYYVEFALDFYSENILYIKSFLERTLFLRNQIKRSFFYKGTFYSTDIRNSAKGTRQYTKHLGDCVFERLELVLKSRPLRSNNITWPLANIDDINLWKFIDFKAINFQKLVDRVTDQYPMNTDDSLLASEHITSLCNYLYCLPLMQVSDYFKDNKLKYFNRCLIDLGWFRSWIDNQIKDQSFLPKQHRGTYDNSNK